MLVYFVIYNDLLLGTFNDRGMNIFTCSNRDLKQNKTEEKRKKKKHMHHMGQELQEPLDPFNFKHLGNFQEFCEFCLFFPLLMSQVLINNTYHPVCP